jgi:hypothetical protein
LDGGPRRKSGHFFNNISQTKNSVWGLNRAFFHCLRPPGGGGGRAKSLRNSLIWGKRLNACTISLPFLSTSQKRTLLLKLDKLNASFHTLSDVYKLICVLSHENFKRHCYILLYDLKALTNLQYKKKCMYYVHRLHMPFLLIVKILYRWNVVKNIL